MIFGTIFHGRWSVREPAAIHVSTCAMSTRWSSVLYNYGTWRLGDWPTGYETVTYVACKVNSYINWLVGIFTYKSACLRWNKDGCKIEKLRVLFVQYVKHYDRSCVIHFT